MKTGQAVLYSILISLGIFILMCITGPVALLIYLGTTIWAAIDSNKIELQKYRSQIAVSPVTLGIGCLLFWIICFPWYLSMRFLIRTGAAQLKGI